MRAQDRPCPGPRPPGPVFQACPWLSWEAGRLSRRHAVGAVWPGRHGRPVPVWRCSPAWPPRPCFPATSGLAPGHRRSQEGPVLGGSPQSLSQLTEPEGLPARDSTSGTSLRLGGHVPGPGICPRGPPPSGAAALHRCSLHYGFRFWQDLGFAPVNSQCFPSQNKIIIIIVF